MSANDHDMMPRAAWVGVALGLAALVGGWWLLYGRERVEEDAQEVRAAEQELAQAAPDPALEGPAVVNPIPEPQPGGAPLPELENSDEAALASLGELFGPKPVESFFVPKELVRRFVLTVDSLDREDPLPLWLRPLRRVSGTFSVDRAADTISVGADNAGRYAGLMAMIEGVDMAALTAAYRRYYPLCQDAYDRLGNPRKRYFNDRLIEVIDHLLATPVVEEPIALVQPKVVYRYADPELEALSSGQKVLLRIGRENAARVQARLREFRSAIATRSAP